MKYVCDEDQSIVDYWYLRQQQRVRFLVFDVLVCLFEMFWVFWVYLCNLFFELGFFEWFVMSDELFESYDSQCIENVV